MNILLSLILSLMIGGQAWATLTAGIVPVTKTGGSTPALQNGSMTDTGTSSGPGNVGIGSTNPQGNLDVPGTICFSHSCLSSWPAGGSQTSGSSILAGNGTGGYTNVTLSGLSYSAGTLSAPVAVQSGSVTTSSGFTISSLLPNVRYKLVLTLLQNTSNGLLEFTFNADGGNNYLWALNGSTYNTQYSGGNSSAGAYIGSGTVDSGQYSLIDMTFSTPGQNTYVLLTATQSYTQSSTFRAANFTGNYTGASNLTSMTITPSAGTVSGKWALYILG